ncbi:MAG: M20/M25/M40 family metallo-hydrolase [Acidobacteriota bacterium]
MKKAIALSVLSLLAFGMAGLAAQTQESASPWHLLRCLVMIPGISGQEGKVIEVIQAAIPPELKPQRDAENNVWFTAGKGSPHLLFVAHADELGFTVAEITMLGTVKLKGRAGFLPQVCEARPFVIHTRTGQVNGILLPRPDFYTQAAQPFNPETYELYVGASTDLEARDLGIKEGDQVIFKKAIVDLGPGLMATRAVDDRAGCAALLAAALAVDWSRIKDRTITFAWSVEEEIGLFGAQAMASAIKPDYVFAVDTFVSSDSPLENKRFGYAQIGRGAVLRAIDSSSITPKTVLRKVLRLAEAKGIPVQVRNSRGGNDGSVFVPAGAVDIPLSWPGAYAHSFIEKIHRRDLENLTSLIRALVTDF